LACGAANDLPSAFAAMRQGGFGDSLDASHTPLIRNGAPIPTIVFHGDRDTTVNPRNGDHVIARSVRTTNFRKTVRRGRVPGGHAYTRTIHADPNGRAIFEHWQIHGAGHAWSGGNPAGSFTDRRGPDATREMVRFFLEHRHTAANMWSSEDKICCSQLRRAYGAPNDDMKERWLQVAETWIGMLPEAQVTAEEVLQMAAGDQDYFRTFH
jgi:hypothetical protein